MKTKKVISNKKAKKTKTRVKPQIKKSNLVAVGLFFFFLSFLLYANTLNHGYTLDDSSIITDNYITKQGVKGIPTIFTTNYRYGYWQSKGSLYRPITSSVLALTWGMVGDKPGVFHFMNVLIYGLLGWILWATLSNLFSQKYRIIAFMSTLLFMVHPVHVEVVANIKSLDEILAFLFCLLALNWLWKYHKQSTNKYLVFSMLAYLMALFSKENAITFLAIFPLAIWFFTKVDLKKNLVTAAFFLAPAAFFLLIRSSVLGDIKGVDKVSPLDNMLAAADSVSTTMGTTFMLIGKYLATLFFPHPLSHEFGFSQLPLVGLGDWKALISIAAVLGLVGYALYRLKDKSLISFGILFFVVTFSVFSNLIITIGSSYGDRFLFMPSLGFAIAISTVLFYVLKGKEIVNFDKFSTVLIQNKAPLMAVGAIALLFALKTITRNPAWKDSYTLYSTDIQTAPNSAKMRFHYGLELGKLALDKPEPRKKELTRQAAQELKKSLELYPNYADAHGQLGLAYYRLGDKVNAIKNYEAAVKIDPGKSKAYSNMGIIYFEQGNLQKAKEVYEKSIAIDPRFVDARRNLGSVFAQMGKFDQAIVQFSEALKYAPDDPTLNYYLYMSNRDKGNTQAAEKYWQKAQRLNPNFKR